MHEYYFPIHVSYFIGHLKADVVLLNDRLHPVVQYFIFICTELFFDAIIAWNDQRKVVKNWPTQFFKSTRLLMLKDDAFAVTLSWKLLMLYWARQALR